MASSPNLAEVARSADRKRQVAPCVPQKAGAGIEENPGRGAQSVTEGSQSRHAGVT